jgi:iron(III) transport system permease protein
MNDRTAAAQIAALLLLMVGALLLAERRARSRMRFAATRVSATEGREARPVVLHGRRALLAWTLCAIPVAFGFVLPLALLAALVWREAVYGEFGLPLARFTQWCLNSFSLAAGAALASHPPSRCARVRCVPARRWWRWATRCRAR